MKNKPVEIQLKWLLGLIKKADRANAEYVKRRPCEDMKEAKAVMELIAYAQAAEVIIEAKTGRKPPYNFTKCN